MTKRVLTVTLNPAIDITLEISDFTTNRVNRVNNSRKDPGGKGINIATALSEGGINCDVTGFLGRENADIFEEHFKNHYITNRFIYIDGSTREGIKVTDHKNRTTTDINFPGFEIDRESIDQFISEYTNMVEDYDYIILSGSLPPNIDRDFYTLLTSISHSRGKFTVLDTSGEALFNAINSGNITLIKPNIDELLELYPYIDKTVEDFHAIDRVVEEILNNVEIVALSLGDRGSRVYTRDGIYVINTPNIHIKSSVGAGDTYLAGFIAGLCMGKNMEEIVKTATSWAASKLNKYGPGLSKERLPEVFLDEIVVKTLPK